MPSTPVPSRSDPTGARLRPEAPPAFPPAAAVPRNPLACGASVLTGAFGVYASVQGVLAIPVMPVLGSINALGGVGLTVLSVEAGQKACRP